MTEAEVLEEQKKYALLRVMRKESYTWNGWRQNGTTLMILPTIWKANVSVTMDLTQYSSIVSRFLETTHWFMPNLEAIKNLLENFSRPHSTQNWVPFEEIAFAFFNSKTLEAPTDRPDYGYELYSMIKELAPLRCRLWTLNPVSQKPEFTDMAPLYVVLGLY